jgi:hypothetical protein
MRRSSSTTSRPAAPEPSATSCRAGLKPGRSYSYKLRVQFDRDGKPVTEDKVVRLTAGENIQLAFGGARIG